MVFKIEEIPSIFTTDETRGLISTKEFNKAAFLINVARAQIVDREALFTALINKTIAAAAFDCFNSTYSRMDS
jgi:phosphoglycerate dehydrogenase-like enzyme